jgi:integrase/recombinase XerD
VSDHDARFARDADKLAWHRYEQNMKRRDLSDETIGGAARTLALLAAALPPGLTLLTAAAEDIEDWLAAIRDDPRTAQSTHATHYRRAHAFYAWAEKRGYLDRSPMAVLEHVKEDEMLIPLPDPAHMAAVLDACKGRDWRDRRDLAMLRVLLEAGTPRASELGGLTLDRLDMRRDRITIFGKGGKQRMIPFGEKAGDALALHLRARAGHRLARVRDEVFLTKYGPMSRSAVYHIIETRCRRAGVPVIAPHHWRHYSAHEWALAGGSEGDAMELFGWSSPLMARRYARAAAASRAIEHAAARAQGDRL